MEKSERVAIAKHVLSLIENETPYMGDESWEADIGRFIDQRSEEHTSELQSH